MKRTLEQSGLDQSSPTVKKERKQIPIDDPHFKYKLRREMTQFLPVSEFIMDNKYPPPLNTLVSARLDKLSLDQKDWILGILPPLLAPTPNRISIIEGRRFMPPLTTKRDNTKCCLKVSLRVPIIPTNDMHPAIANKKIEMLIDQNMVYLQHKQVFKGLLFEWKLAEESNEDRLVFDFTVHWQFPLDKFIMELAFMINKVSRGSPYKQSVFDPSDNTTSANVSSENAA